MPHFAGDHEMIGIKRPRIMLYGWHLTFLMLMTDGMHVTLVLTESLLRNNGIAKFPFLTHIRRGTG